MSNRVETKTVVSVERLDNSAMGNPAWLFGFDDGTTAPTSMNVSFSLQVDYYSHLDKTYDVYMTASGRIIDMTPVSKYAVDPSVEYVCHFQKEDGSICRAIYNVFGGGNVHTAMAMHNTSKPEYATTVIKWISPEGVVIENHDNELSL